MREIQVGVSGKGSIEALISPLRPLAQCQRARPSFSELRHPPSPRVHPQEEGHRQSAKIWQNSGADGAGQGQTRPSVPLAFPARGGRFFAVFRDSSSPLPASARLGSSNKAARLSAFERCWCHLPSGFSSSPAPNMAAEHVGGGLVSRTDPEPARFRAFRVIPPSPLGGSFRHVIRRNPFFPRLAFPPLAGGRGIFCAPRQISIRRPHSGAAGEGGADAPPLRLAGLDAIISKRKKMDGRGRKRTKERKVGA